ncbi:flagellin, partial [Schwartzia sp. (in: firmicutes)]
KEKQTNSTPIVVDELKSLTKLGATNTTTNAKDSDVKATFTMDLTSYADKYNESDMESFISELKGKVLQWEYYLDNRLMEKKAPMYGFVDSHGDFSPTTHKARSIEAVPLFSGATALDLNELRGQVSSGKSVADVATTWLKEKLGDRAKTHNEDNSIEEGKIVLESYIGGTAGNRDDVHAYKGTLRSYTIDFASALAGKSIPDDLDGKGFRVYCATHQGQWFNIEFVNGLHNADSRPRSGAEGKDVKTLLIDVSQVHNANDLAAAIYDQAQPVLTSGDPYWDHYFRLASDTKNGTLTIYDNRTRRVNTSEYTYQIDGAKIADGVIDNISEGVQHLRVNDLIIHHTDRASMNIRVRIPQTTMDHLFGYQSGTRDLSEFNVLTAKSREELLGNKPGYTRSGEYITEEDEGLLDKAIKYLTNANCLVGAQISRLQMTESNIVISHESTQSSESTIRDADMAMEMANYTKSSVLAQAAQSMLAQANQNSSGVLSLLQ